ncbi:hypothetical protein ACLOJK_026707 [Asimina triloba]
MPLILFARRMSLSSPRSVVLSGFRKRRRRFALLSVDAGIDRSEGGHAAGGEGEAPPKTKMLSEMGCGQTRFALPTSSPICWTRGVNGSRSTCDPVPTRLLLHRVG